MSFINYSSREINCKIVYYGPGLCGKTTNLQYIYNKTNPETKGKLISLSTETDRLRRNRKVQLEKVARLSRATRIKTSGTLRQGPAKGREVARRKLSLVAGT
jgi:GTPase SAR1 family protein